MNTEENDFIQEVKKKFPSYFKGQDVLDWSYEERHDSLFDNGHYTHLMDKDPGWETKNYDVVISIVSFPHSIHFIENLKKIVHLVKSKGLFFFVCHTMESSLPTTTNKRIITNEDFPIPFLFSSFYCEISGAIYFWGIRSDREESSMSQIFDKYLTDKNSSWHNYPRDYEIHFSPYRNRENINYLEIGVFEGGSIKAMREYLSKARYLIGIDINPQCKQSENPDQNIFIEIGSQSDETFLQSVNTKYQGFDIILDDGSHFVEDLVVSFETLFPLLRKGGMYIVEDTHAYKTFKRDPSSVDTLTYFTRYLPGLNRWGGPGYSCDREKLPPSDNFYDNIIHSITYGQSFIIIKKL